PSLPDDPNRVLSGPHDVVGGGDGEAGRGRAGPPGDALARPARPARRDRHPDQGRTEAGQRRRPGPLPPSGICPEGLYRARAPASPEPAEAAPPFPRTSRLPGNAPRVASGR